MTSSVPEVLLVSPDTTLTQLMVLDLQAVGYAPQVESHEHPVLSFTAVEQPALVVVDHVQLQERAVQLCQTLRAEGDRRPILLLTASDGVSDRVACLEAGADDYLSLPYRSDRFLEQVQFYLEVPGTPGEQLRFGDLVLDTNTRRALRGGREFDLTMKEFELLRYLMQHPRQVVTREQILENVWGYDFVGESNVIEVYIRYLRLKIEDEGEKRLIQTVRGVGYVLREA